MLPFTTALTIIGTSPVLLRGQSRSLYPRTPMVGRSRNGIKGETRGMGHWFHTLPRTKRGDLWNCHQDTADILLTPLLPFDRSLTIIGTRTALWRGQSRNTYPQTPAVGRYITGYKGVTRGMGHWVNRIPRTKRGDLWNSHQNTADNPHQRLPTPI